MTQEYRLEVPMMEEQIRKMNCGDIVYISGIIHTMRDISHRRAVDMVESGEKLPFDLSSGVLWHCAPIVRQDTNGKWEAISAGSTTSSKFSYLGAKLIEALNIRCTIGKGTMYPPAVEAMVQTGSCFLNATGGAAAMYAGSIEEVIDVFWTDLGLPEAIWVLRVKDLGPFIVGIDSNGQSLFDRVSEHMKTNLSSIYQKSGINPDYNFTYLPKRVAAKGKS